MRTLWDKQTGESIKCDAIDAREILSVLSDRYTDVAPPTPPPPPPPPGITAPPPSPLAGLPDDWATTLKTAQLRALAETVSGRAVENREQAIQVIRDAKK